MKFINRVLVLLGVSVIQIGLLALLFKFNLESIYNIIGCVVVVLIGIGLYYSASRYEKQLEDEAEKVYIKYNDSCEEIERLRALLEKYENKLPFTDDSQPETQGYVCPKCGKEMTRMTLHTVYCDNIECTRKQWKRDKLDKGE